MKTIILFIVVIGAQGHNWSFGSCPSIPPVSNLSIDKFVGLWYVIEQFDTSSSCLTINYTRTSETTLQITKQRQFYLLDKAGLGHTSSYTGSLDIPYSSNPGLLRVKWPMNAAGKGDYIIFDTDYNTYAAVYDCQSLAFFLYRESAAILSRTPTLEPIYIDRVKRRLENFAVDVSHLNVIDHKICRGRDDSDFNISVDEDTFKEVLSNTADSIKDVANKLADGVQTVATSVLNEVKNIGGSTYANRTEVPMDNLNEVEIIQ